MSEVKKCPKCGGEMEKGTLSVSAGISLGIIDVKFTNKSSRGILSSMKRPTVDAFACKVCGYTEIYREMNEA